MMNNYERLTRRKEELTTVHVFAQAVIINSLSDEAKTVHNNKLWIADTSAPEMHMVLTMARHVNCDVSKSETVNRGFGIYKPSPETTAKILALVEEEIAGIAKKLEAIDVKLKAIDDLLTET